MSIDTKLQRINFGTNTLNKQEIHCIQSYLCKLFVMSNIAKQ